MQAMIEIARKTAEYWRYVIVTFPHSERSGNRPPAIVFYARDFLSEEFPNLSGHLGAYERVYIVSKAVEAERVRSGDPDGHVLSLSEAIDATRPGDIVHDALFSQLYSAVSRDRYLRRMEPEEIARVVHALRSLTDQIDAQFDAQALFDEPVSGIVNELLNRWMTERGGRCLHFQTTWVPGYMFFAQDAGQTQPVALNMTDDGVERARAHIENRLENKALPTYLHNYGSILRTAKEASRFGLLGLNRLLRKSEIFLDADPWPHFFQARCLLNSIFSRYDDISDLRAGSGPAKVVVFPLHYEPEAVIYYFSKFTNQLDLASGLLDRLPPDTYLLLKEHPSQPGALHLPKWRELRQNKRVKIVKGTTKLTEIFKYQSAVVSIASTAALEAAMLGHPAYVVGTPHFRHFPGVTSLNGLDELEIDWDQAPADRAEMAEWYGEFLNQNCAPLQIMRGRTNIPDPVALLTALGLETGGKK